MSECKALTDLEIEALQYDLNLADGHAYEDMTAYFPEIIRDLNTLWEKCETTRIPDMEHRFRQVFAMLSGSIGMSELPYFKICPTASNSIDIIGAVLAQKGLLTRLVEPTFDNLALILRRRGVKLESLSENDLILAGTQGAISSLLDAHPCDALFLVQPNNPTGNSLNSVDLQVVVDHCAVNGRILVLDNSFRFYNRHPFDDYSILIESGISFMAFEDTGKVWPTHDLKASLLFCSPNLQWLVTSVYNELYMCHSRFTLALLEQCLLKTAEIGLSRTIWQRVDERRNLLRRTIENTGLTVEATAINSQISVEWLDCRGTGLRDLELTKILASKGLWILPGRQFFWQSRAQIERHHNVRLALIRPLRSFKQAMEIIRSMTHSDIPTTSFLNS